MNNIPSYLLVNAVLRCLSFSCLLFIFRYVCVLSSPEKVDFMHAVTYPTGSCCKFQSTDIPRCVVQYVHLLGTSSGYGHKLHRSHCDGTWRQTSTHYTGLPLRCNHSTHNIELTLISTENIFWGRVPCPRRCKYIYEVDGHLPEKYRPRIFLASIWAGQECGRRSQYRCIHAWRLLTIIVNILSTLFTEFHSHSLRWFLPALLSSRMLNYHNRLIPRALTGSFASTWSCSDH